jgi:Flp pilus assembly pilin Flp
VLRILTPFFIEARRKHQPDAFYFPQAFIAGVVISYFSVAYLTLLIISYLAQVRGAIESGFSNVYDMLFAFLRTGNDQVR